MIQSSAIHVPLQLQLCKEIKTGKLTNDKVNWGKAMSGEKHRDTQIQTVRETDGQTDRRKVRKNEAKQ